MSRWLSTLGSLYSASMRRRRSITARSIMLGAATIKDLEVEHLGDSLLGDGDQDPLNNVSVALIMVEVLGGELIDEDLGGLIGEHGVGCFCGLDEGEEAEVGEEGLKIRAEKDVSIFLQPSLLE
ncbi:hypothetical protein ACLOJK_022290 [Asimina triloba]